MGLCFTLWGPPPKAPTSFLSSWAAHNPPSCPYCSTVQWDSVPPSGNPSRGVWASQNTQRGSGHWGLRAYPRTWSGSSYCQGHSHVTGKETGHPKEQTWPRLYHQQVAGRDTHPDSILPASVKCPSLAQVQPSSPTAAGRCPDSQNPRVL